MSADQKQQQRLVAIVAGATAGIGAATTRALHIAGYRVFGSYQKLPATKVPGIDEGVLLPILITLNMCAI